MKRHESGWRNVLVIGGGPAGSAAAIRLRDHGITTTLVEQKTFPRDKVCGCCLGGAGIDALGHLGCRDAVLRHARTLRVWQGSLGGRSVCLPLRNNIAVSREALDVELLAHARDRGATIRQPATATIQNVAPEGVEVRVRHAAAPAESSVTVFDGVIVAAGLSAAVPAGVLPWIDRPHGPFGVSVKADQGDGFPEDAVMMVCDDDGYVGLVELADGRIDVAAALKSGGPAAKLASPIERVVSMLRRSDLVGRSDWFDAEAISASPEIMTTPPLRRSRLAGSGRLMLIGDAAGYVEPFTGEGMTWAMQAGLAAGDFVAGGGPSSLRGVPPSSLADHWPAELDRVLGRQRRTCRMISSALRRPFLRRLGGGLLAGFPGVASPVIRHLNRGVSFPGLSSD